MANPRQRRKVRSSSHKPVKQSKRTNKLLKKQPPIKGPKVLQDAWDNHKTVRQNYAALGLAHTMNPNDSGGKDITHLPVINTQDRQNAEASPEEDKSGSGVAEPPKGPSTDEKLPRGFGRIIRDESGAIVDVVLGEEDMPVGEEAADKMELEEIEIGSWTTQGGIRDTKTGAGWLLGSKDSEGGETEGAKEVLRALEGASKGGSKKTRRSTRGEIEYLRRLVDAHGREYERMSRDRKRNVHQYSAGQLRRAVEKAGLGRSESG